MYHDLDTEQSDFTENEIIKPLFAGNNSVESTQFAQEYNIDEPEIESKVPCLVMDADSSQFSTLVDIANGKNLAVEGPPGTGKSQTIVNAIAAALAGGKKILFVAEKMAALNVVRSRLEAIKLGEFLLPLQADRSSRENVVRSIRERIEMDPGRASRDYESEISLFRKHEPKPHCIFLPWLRNLATLDLLFTKYLEEALQRVVFYLTFPGRFSWVNFQLKWALRQVRFTT